MSPIVQAILALALVAVTGLLLGGIKFRGIGMGTAGVLFAGILVGHFGFTIDHEIGHFVKEFGLVLFVFMIGLHLGPGIVQLWKQQGILLNSLALTIVAMGFLLVLATHQLGLVNAFSASGLFSGATTNTPSLGAAQQAAQSFIVEANVISEGKLDSNGSVQIMDSETNEGDSTERSSIQPTNQISLMASAYAVAYPGAIVGIIGSMLILRRVFAIDLKTEANNFASKNGKPKEKIERQCVLVDNDHLDGTHFGDLPGLEETGIRISRIRRVRDDKVTSATVETEIYTGDIVQLVGTADSLDRFSPMIGSVSDVDLMDGNGSAKFRGIVVTETNVLNKSLRELSLDRRFEVSITRLRRAGVELPSRGSLRLQYGDVVNAVGTNESLDRVSELLGNSVRSLNNTQFLPMFLGIGVGVLAGMVPIQVPGIPFPVKLGLAGGPLIAAIILSMVGRVGQFVFYIPHSANLALRELGIILFLASAGLAAGETFVATVMTPAGLIWMATGLVVTTVPLLTVGAAARYFFKMNYLTVCGVVAGSMTDPPALAFANSQSESDACTTAYASVYPLTMVLRIIAAQSIIYLLA